MNRTEHEIESGEHETGSYDGILILVPARFRERFRPLLGKNLKIQIEPFNLGLSLLIYPENQLESEAGISVSKKGWENEYV